MQAIFKNKIFLIIIFLFILATFGYRLFVPKIVEVTEESALSVGKDLIQLSDQLSNAQLSQTLFSMPGYLFLTDFTAPIPQQSFGRVNPFDIIGRD